MRIAALASASFGLLVAITTAAVADPPDGGEIELGEGSGSAAPVQKDPKQAKKLVATGQQAAAKGDQLAKKKPDDAKAQYEAAADAFRKAIDLGDDVNVYFYLAGVEAKLGKYVDAVKAYRTVLRAQQGVDPKLQKQVSGKLDEVMAQVGTLTLTVVPDGTNISIGNETVGTTPLPEPLVLMPGTYTLALSAAGYDPKTVEVKVEAGSENEKKVTLDSVKIVIERPHGVADTDTDKPPPPRPPSLVPVYVGGGVAAGFLVGTIVSGVLAKSNHDTFVNPNTLPGDRLDAKDTGVAYAHLSDACLAGTVVAAGFAAYWYVFQYRKHLDHHEPAKVSVAPWVEPNATTPTTAGLTVLGRF